MRMDRDEIEALAEWWMRFWQGAGLEGFLELHEEGFVDHSAGGRGSDREAFRASAAALYAPFPDCDARTELLVVDDMAGLVAIRWRGEGRHAGQFMGRAATGRTVRFHGIEILRVASGRVRERWGEWDEGAIAEQLLG